MWALGVFSISGVGPQHCCLILGSFYPSRERAICMAVLPARPAPTRPPSSCPVSVGWRVLDTLPACRQAPAGLRSLASVTVTRCCLREARAGTSGCLSPVPLHSRAAVPSTDKPHSPIYSLQFCETHVSQHVKTGRPPANPGVQHPLRAQKPPAHVPCGDACGCYGPRDPETPTPALCSPPSLDAPGFGDGMSMVQ